MASNQSIDFAISEVTYARTGRRTLTVPTSIYKSLGFMNLLTPDGYNPKTRRGRARGYATYILHLSPSRKSGRNVCGHFASPKCIQTCLDESGHAAIGMDANGMNAIHRARLARTRLFFEDFATFVWLLQVEMETAIRRSAARGDIVTFRLNGTSDLSWEHIRLLNGKTVFETYPEVQFYDYTKNPARALKAAAGQQPANYSLTFSHSELNETECLQVLAAGGNVAVVFDCGQKHDAALLPATWHGYPVINGDTDDLRFLDPRGVIVGLTAKGRAIGQGAPGGFILPGQAALALAA